VAVIGEGLTEYRYMEAMRAAERYRFRIFPGIPKHSGIRDMVALCRKRLAEGYDHVLCLVDMDVMLRDRRKAEEYGRLKRDNPAITFVESNACTEYWFLMHFMRGVSSREYPTYDSIAAELRKHIPGYDKTEAFFNKTDIYAELKRKGDMENAVSMSRNLDELRKKEPDVYRSYSQMHKLFAVLDSLSR